MHIFTFCGQAVLIVPIGSRSGGPDTTTATGLSRVEIPSDPGLLSPSWWHWLPVQVLVRIIIIIIIMASRST